MHVKAQPKKVAGRRGQALIEMGIVVVMMVFLVVGITEVGFAFMRTNMVVNAARDGARFGATIPAAQRNPDGCLTGGTSVIQQHVQTLLDTIGFAATINVVQSCVDAVPTIEVQVVGTLPLVFVNFFQFFPDGIPVTRSVTFEDEGRSGCAC